MKLTVILLFGSLVAMSANTYSQNTRLNLSAKNSSLIDIFRQIEDQSEFYFYFQKEELKAKEPVSIELKEVLIDEVLDQVLANTGLEYKIIDRYVVVKPKGATDPVMGMQPGRKVSGKVTDSSGATLPGVSVVAKGTQIGVITDADGYYSLSNIPSNTTLSYSFVGMKSLEITIGNKTTINVVMEEEPVGIEEVVAIGYGAVKKSDLTGSVSSVRSNDLNVFPTNSAVQALQGRAAGVQIQSSNGGEPGGNYNILIRGSSSINASGSPLYVIDGFPQGALPPANDIESIEILKDASATAIYGSRGANGVVMITTKKGAIGNVKINLNSSYSVQNITNRYDLLNAQQYGELINNVSGKTIFTNPASLGVGTDWQDQILQTGNVKNYNLSLSGGSDKITYYLSGVYFDQKGIIINSDFKKYSLTSNIDFKASDKLTFGLNMLVGRNDQNRLSTQEGTTTSQSGGIMSTALLFAPSQPVYNSDGSYTLQPLGEPLDNPIAIANEMTAQTLSDYMQTNIFGELNLLKNLKYKLIVGVGTNNSRDGRYSSSKLIYGGIKKGIGSMTSTKNTNTLVENYLTYSKKINEIHNLTLMAGYSFQSFSTEYTRAEGSGLLTDAGTWWNLGSASTYMQPYSSLTESILSSLYGRINYSMNDKYLFTTNIRYDGSSRFAANKKWAFFPSGAFAWNVYKEGFLADSKVVSQLKLRTSYGITGNQAINPYQSLATLKSIFSVNNGKIVNAVSPLSVANDNLTWESTAQTDLGFDLGLFNNKLIINADYYKKVTSDLLFEVPLAQYSGFSTQLKNIGKIKNTGFEFSLQVNDITRVIKWDSKFNFSLNRNKILELPSGKEIKYAAAPGGFVGISASQIMREGEPLGSFYGYIYEGVQQSGDELLTGAEGLGGERFMDFTKDGVLNDKDRTIIGDPNPDFCWGWSNNFGFKNFDLDIFWRGVEGNDMLNYTRMGLEQTLGTYNTTTAMLNSWTPTNIETDIPKAAKRSQRLSSRWVEDGSYIRLENVTLGYTIPQNVLNKIKLHSLRIYVSGQKLLTFTKYKGFDPEVSWGSSNKNIGLDYGSYPNTRNFTVGINVGF